MSGVYLSRVFAGILSASLALLSLPSVAGDQPPTDTPTRAPHVQLRIDVPQTHGPWRMVLSNQDRVPVRVVADARRLSLLIRGPEDTKYTRCELPSSMQGSVRKRQLVLGPGQQYVERFDPRMYCWGSVSEKLAPGASVTAFLGWEDDKRRRARKKPQVPPFVVEPVLASPAFQSQKRIASLTHWLPQGDIVQANPEVPERPTRFVGAPDLRLKTHRWADATTYRDARLTATLTNVGDRSALVHLRPDDLQVRVRQPNGSMVVCGPGTGYRAAVRDFFQTIKPGKSATVSILLSELCPSDALQRPGLYELHTTLRVRDDGSSFRLDALTGDFPAPKSTLLRIRDSREPYHPHPPRVRSKKGQGRGPKEDRK